MPSALFGRLLRFATRSWIRRREWLFGSRLSFEAVMSSFGWFALVTPFASYLASPVGSAWQLLAIVQMLSEPLSVDPNRVGPEIWRASSIRAPWLALLLALFDVSAQTTSAPPCLLTSTWKKSARLRSPPVVQPSPIVQMPPL